VFWELVWQKATQTSPAIVENQELESLFLGEIFVDKNNSSRTRWHQLSSAFPF